MFIMAAPNYSIYLVIVGLLLSKYPKVSFQAIGIAVFIATCTPVLQTTDKPKSTLYNFTEKSDKKLRTKEILTQLKKIPVSEYKKNRDLYKELVYYYPDVLKYKQKVTFYDNRIKRIAESSHEN